MSGQHTLGPWLVRDARTDDEGEVAGAFCVEAPGAAICDNVYIEADATLIAAAPDMRDALRAILFQLCQGKVLERDACVTQARAALAKAEGRP